MIFGKKYMKPSFLIIGGVKCGTSSLYQYLNAHPNVLPCKTKEPEFLIKRNPISFLKGIKKYASLFPENNFYGTIEAGWLDLDGQGVLQPDTIIKTKEKNKPYITGEATARTYYLARPQWVKLLLPTAKIIMLVRNPTDRVYSHFQMYLRWHQQGKSKLEFTNFNDYINHQFERKDKGLYNILEQGCYMNYLPKWKGTFGEKNIRIFHSSEFSKTQKANQNLNELCTFLDLPQFDFTSSLQKKHNKGNYKKMSEQSREKLNDFYHKYNLLFEEEFGIKL